MVILEFEIDTLTVVTPPLGNGMSVLNLKNPAKTVKNPIRSVTFNCPSCDWSCIKIGTHLGTYYFEDSMWKDPSIDKHWRCARCDMVNVFGMYWKTVTESNKRFRPVFKFIKARKPEVLKWNLK